MRVKSEKSGLQVIPGVGPSIAQDLVSMGIHTVADLKGQDPQALYDRLCELTRTKQDRCVLYTFRCAVYYASNSRHEPERLKWWNWMDDSPAMQKRKR